MTRVLTLLAVLGFGSFAAAEDKADAPKLEGTYTIVSGERDGKPIPKSEFEGSVIRFKGNKITGHDKDKKEFFGATYTIDTSAKPHKIMMTSTAPKADLKAGGVIEVNGDTVKLCYGLPGGDAPTGFKTGEKQQCFVLKKTSE